jgi:uncharacterized membrane protein YqjE
MATTTEVIQNIVGNVGDIVRSEVQLAKAEVKHEAMKAARGGAMAAAGALLALFGLGFVFWTIAAGLTAWMPVWAASLIVGVVLLAMAGALAMTGINRIRNARPKPEQTIESVKEDVQWIKSRT